MAESDTSSVTNVTPRDTPMGIPPEALELLDRSPPGLRPLLKLLYAQDRGELVRAAQRLARKWTKPGVRAAAAPAVVPYLYGLLGLSGMQDLRSFPLQHLGFIALGFSEDHVPQGFDGGAAAEATEAGRGADARSAYAAVEATVPQLYPFLADRDTPVRTAAAHLLAFFPSARETAGPALLARVAREPNTETRCTASVAVAMLYRGVADAAARTAVCAQLEQQWASVAAAATAQGDSTADAANDAAMARFTVALARCIVGVHAVDDVEVVTDVLTSPFDDRQRPREPKRDTLEVALPFAYPSLKALAGKVLQQLPGPGPQPLAVVRVLAKRVRHAPLACSIYAIDATLNSACGHDAVPAAWPAFAALDERQQEAVRGLAKIEADSFVFLRSRLERWRLPASAAGLKAYMGGTAAAVAAEQSQAELDEKLTKMINKTVKQQARVEKAVTRCIGCLS